MVEIRHTHDDSPSQMNHPDFTSEPGDVVDVDEEVAERLTERPYFEYEEEYELPPGADEGEDNTITTADFTDEDVDVADEESTGATEAQKEAGIRPGEADERDTDADIEQEDYDTADFRDDEIDVADEDSEGETVAEQQADVDTSDPEALAEDATVPQVQDAIEAGDVDLDSLEEAEQDRSGGERVGVMEAIDDARTDETEG